MKIYAINNIGNTHFTGAESTLDKVVEKAAETLPTKTNMNRKTISIELHNAMVKLTAYRVAFIVSGLFGFLGYKITDKVSDNRTEDVANTIECADIDTNAPIEIKDMTNDGCADLVLQKNDSSKLILDIKNSKVFMESNGYREVK